MWDNFSPDFISILFFLADFAFREPLLLRFGLPVVCPVPRPAACKARAVHVAQLQNPHGWLPPAMCLRFN